MTQRERNRIFMSKYRLRPAVRERMVKYRQLYRQRNQSALRETDRLYYTQNRDKILEQCRAERLARRWLWLVRPVPSLIDKRRRRREQAKVYYWSDPTKYRRKARVYKDSHPDEIRHRLSRYRARKRKADGKHTFIAWLDKVAFHGWRCHYCHSELVPSTITKDHVMPLSRGGSDWASNLVPSCRSCNSRKRTASSADFLRRIDAQSLCPTP